jgi:hypothetical protein
MSWIDQVVEQQIAAAIRRGELDTPEHLRGASLDLDTQRGDGWWAEQFVRKERVRLLREDSMPQRAARAAAFWRVPTVPLLLEQVADANKWIAGVNQQLQPADHLDLFVPREVIADWHLARRG